MKKLFLFLILSASLMGENLKDGSYSVQTDKSIWFWYPRTTILVEDGIIVDATHDRIKKDGRLASKDDWYNEKMLKKTGSNPERYSRDIPASYFRAGGDLEKMDNIAGATDSTIHFKRQMDFLLEKAAKGETGEFTMPKKDLK